MVTAHGDYWDEVFPGVVLMGAGMGLIVVPLNNLALHRVVARDAGVASATATATNQIGASVGLAGLTAVATAVTSGAGHGIPAVVAGNAAVFGAGACVFAAIAVVSLVLLRQPASGDDAGSRPEHALVPVAG